MTTRKCFAFAELPGREVFELPPSASVEPMFGIQINSLSIEDLFDLYTRTGFLYSTKRERLAPVWHIVKKNWERLRTVDKLLHYVVEVRDPHSGALTSLCLWRFQMSTGWFNIW